MYTKREPFDPKKIHDFFNAEWPGVLRTKGYFWISTRPEFAGELSQAGAFVRHECMGQWWDAVSEDQWPTGEDFARLVQKYWHKDYGDRRQEIVFIGLRSEMDERAIRAQLDACIIHDYMRDPKQYQNLPDPFPEWMQEVV